MPVQRYEYTSREGKPMVGYKWFMPEGMSEEIPKDLDIDGCLSLLARMYREEVRELKALYSARRRRAFRTPKDRRDNAYAIKQCETWFKADPYGSGIPGNIPINECRKEIYGPNWEMHPDFFKPKTSGS